ncbi:MAG: hypothetical protein G3M70_06295 [Candidatus Nitronauta litoralis]|uniref:Uncharacterized protein n=1 Tax=Candidatus Nitronauta litoralis TaxID=2705533 RepID=A0A7T0FZN9_9BACT|nr:MAG: hypothetical protein G3M70_06295 [Candidatus Nitronauta litoralis]
MMVPTRSQEVVFWEPRWSGGKSCPLAPRGLMDSKKRDPRNFTLAEWQQDFRSVGTRLNFQTP